MSSEMINHKTCPYKGKLTGITQEKRSIIQNKGKHGNIGKNFLLKYCFVCKLLAGLCCSTGDE